MLDVDFEWFDPQPAVDFHGLKTLLRQLFDVDNQLFDLSALTDLILSQPTLGSTVKTDGNETDPYAFLTVLNMHQHKVSCIIRSIIKFKHSRLTADQDKPVIQELSKYLLARAANNPSLSQLTNLLSPNSPAQLGLILTERFINMPHQIVPPMYNMLIEEMQWAREEKEPYEFSHYIVVSKTYTEVASKLDQEDSRPTKKKKQPKEGEASETFYFHPEDEILQKFAMGSCNFDYVKQGEDGSSDAKRAFQELGVRPQGHLVLIDGGKFEGAVKAVEQYLNGSA